MAGVITLNGNTITGATDNEAWEKALKDATDESTVSAQNATITQRASVAPKVTYILENSTFSGNVVSGSGGAIVGSRGFTVTGGTFSGNRASSYGGAIFRSSSWNGQLTGVTLVGNSAGSSGGAIYVYASSGSVTLDSVTASGNTATTGGAVFIYTENSGTLILTGGTYSGNCATTQGGALFNQGIVTVSDALMVGNSASNGGALYNYKKVATVSNVLWQGNTATNGGAVYNNGGIVNVSGGTFSGNTATNGGALYTTYGATISNVLWSGNTAGIGGAVYNNGGIVNVSGGTFSGNTADYGGAVFNAGGTLSVNGGTFSGNRASNNGGAVYSQVSNSVEFRNVAFIGNTATSNGGALFIYGDGEKETTKTLTLAGVIFDGNAATNGGALYLVPQLKVVLEGAITLATASDTISGSATSVTIDTAAFVESLGERAYYKVIDAVNTNQWKSFAGATVSGSGYTKSGVGSNLYVKSTDTEKYKFSTAILSDDVTAGCAGSVVLDGQTVSGVNFASSDQALAENFGANRLIFEGATLTDRMVIPAAKEYDYINLQASTGKTSDSNGGVFSYVPYNNANGAMRLSGGDISSNASAGSGGAIYVYSNTTSRLSLENVRFSGNTAAKAGGAVYYYIEKGGTLNVSGGTFSGNVAGEGGGALYTKQDATTISNVLWSGNTATNGGAVFKERGTLSVNGGTFSGNTATNGGAVYNNGSIFNVSGGTFSGNTASNGGALYTTNGATISNVLWGGNTATNGGAVYIKGGIFNVSGGTFSGNRASSNGGALYNMNGATISNALLCGNTATYGGAVFNAGGTLSVNGGTFSGNAAASGGAVYSQVSNSVEFRNVAFIGNTATSNGGALFIYGDGKKETTKTLTLAGVIFDGNAAKTGGALYLAPELKVVLEGAITLATESDTISGSATSVTINVDKFGKGAYYKVIDAVSANQWTPFAGAAVSGSGYTTSTVGSNLYVKSETADFTTAIFSADGTVTGTTIGGTVFNGIGYVHADNVLAAAWEAANYAYDGYVGDDDLTVVTGGTIEGNSVIAFKGSSIGGSYAGYDDKTTVTGDVTLLVEGSTFSGGIDVAGAGTVGGSKTLTLTGSNTVGGSITTDTFTNNGTLVLANDLTLTITNTSDLGTISGAYTLTVDGTQVTGKSYSAFTLSDDAAVSGGFIKDNTLYYYNVVDSEITETTVGKEVTVTINGVDTKAIYGVNAFTSRDQITNSAAIISVNETISGGNLGGGTNVLEEGVKITGNLYGAGSGTVSSVDLTLRGASSSATVLGGGSTLDSVVTGNIDLKLEDATIDRIVYGGGQSGTVTGSITTTVSGDSVIGKNFYGGSLISSSLHGTYEAGAVNVNIEGGSFGGHVVGGSRVNGASFTEDTNSWLKQTVDSVALNVTGGTFFERASVFAGGYLVGKQDKNVQLEITNGVNVTLNADILGDTATYGSIGVYGGALASNYGTASIGKGTSAYAVQITVEDGHYSAIYGAGWAESHANSQVSGGVSINVNGGSIGNLFAGGNNDTSGATANVSDGGAIITLAGGTVDNLYASSKWTTSKIDGNTEVNITGGTITGMLSGWTPNGRDAVTGTQTLDLDASISCGQVLGFDVWEVASDVKLTATTEINLEGGTAALGTNAELESASINLTGSTVALASGANFDIAGEIDLKDVTLKLDVAEWTVASGSAISNLADAAGVTIGGVTADKVLEEEKFAYWSATVGDDTWKLSVVDKTLTLAKLA